MDDALPLELAAPDFSEPKLGISTHVLQRLLLIISYESEKWNGAIADSDVFQHPQHPDTCISGFQIVQDSVKSVQRAGS